MTDEKDEKKSLFDKAIDALTNRDEKAAAAEAQAKAEALKAKAEADRLAAERAAAAKLAADKAAAEKLAAERAAAAKLAAEKAAADKAAAERRAAEQKAMAEKAAAEAAARAAAAPKKGTVLARSLHIRKDHSASSAEVGGLIKGNEVTILETWTDGKNTWGKLGPDRWAAIVYNGETYIQLA